MPLNQTSPKDKRGKDMIKGVICAGVVSWGTLRVRVPKGRGGLLSLEKGMSFIYMFLL